jgi:hypothetical protein
MKEKTHKILIEITTKELKYFMDKLSDTIFSFRLKKGEVLEWRQLHDEPRPELIKATMGEEE